MKGWILIKNHVFLDVTFVWSELIGINFFKQKKKTSKQWKRDISERNICLEQSAPAEDSDKQHSTIDREENISRWETVTGHQKNVSNLFRNQNNFRRRWKRN